MYSLTVPGRGLSLSQSVSYFTGPLFCRQLLYAAEAKRAARHLYARTQNCTQQDAAELRSVRTVVPPLRAPPYGENERCIAGDRMLLGCWDVRQIATGPAPLKIRTTTTHFKHIPAVIQTSAAVPQRTPPSRRRRRRTRLCRRRVGSSERRYSLRVDKSVGRNDLRYALECIRRLLANDLRQRQ